jgi:leader peptidase (prepilin peptidase) / N-methyltransferase
MEAVRAMEPWSTHVGAYGFAVLLGLLWGSFANVCIYRMPPTAGYPSGRSVVTPGSHCGVCLAPVRWYDNVPVISYLWLRGRCRDCGSGFSARYLLVEALTGALFAVAWWAAVEASAMWEPFELRLLRFAIYAAFVLVMVVVTFIDLDHQLILDRVTYPSIVVFFAAGLLLGNSWRDGLIGAAVGYGAVWGIAEVYYRLTGREGMGLGDGKLLAVVGALLGWRGVVVALFGGSLVGSVLGIGGLLLARSRREATASAPAGDGGDGEEAKGTSGDTALTHAEIPFGPYLAIAAMFYLFAEPWVRINVAWLGS